MILICLNIIHQIIQSQICTGAFKNFQDQVQIRFKMKFHPYFKINYRIKLEYLLRKNWDHNCEHPTTFLFYSMKLSWPR